MITKQDLEDYRYHEIELEQQMQKMQMWQNKLTRLQTSYNIVCKLGEYQRISQQLEDIVKETLTYVDITSQKYLEIDNLIRNIPEPRIRSVMNQYYILCAADWDEVAAILGLSKRTVHRLHGYGLEIIKHMQEKPVESM